MRKIYLALVIGLFMITASASAQNSGYTTGIGLRGGWESGITIKHFISDGRAIEGILSRGWGWGGFRITGLYEIQKGITGVEGLNWFYGAGAHVGFYSGKYYGYKCYNGGYWDNKGNWHHGDCRDRYMAIGIDGILGLEYQIKEIPFTLGLDIKPSIDLIGWGGSHFGDGAFSVRYVF